MPVAVTVQHIRQEITSKQYQLANADCQMAKTIIGKWVDTDYLCTSSA